MVSILGCFHQPYDWKLLALAALICAIACFATVTLLSRAQATEAPQKFIWLSGAAAVFGSGVWALHFIAMMAYMPGFRVGYDLFSTGSSIVIAMLGAAAAFLVWERLGRKAAGIAVGGTLLAAAIAGMHYDGVLAMHVSALIHFNAVRVTTSILFTTAMASVFLHSAADLGSIGRRMEASCYLGITVLGLHFIGMSALTVAPGLGDTRGEIISSEMLAVAVGSISIAIILCGMVGALTDRRLTDQAEREAERLKQLADASFEGIVIHCGGVIRDCNKTFAHMVGRSIDELIGHPAMDFVTKKDLPRLQERMAEHQNGGRIEFDFDVPGARSRPVEVLSRPIEFRGQKGFVSAVRDLSERRRAEQKIRHLAHHDSLTGLCNRAALNDRLNQMIALAARAGEQLAVLYLDLDRFKPVNDLLGHEAGDRLLVDVAQRLKKSVRASDIVARMGGDEFVIVQAVGAELERAPASAARVISMLSEPFTIGGDEAVVSASVGIALFPANGRTAEELLRNADKAMYHAKETARGTSCVFSVEIEDRLHQKRLMEHDLRHAIERKQLEVHYQPIFAGQTSGIVGVEALVRWRHPVRGMISPADFIPIAEESGLICELGAWVLETACKEATAWPAHVRVAVNVSPAQFTRDDFAESVECVLDRTGLNPGRLELEVTESLLIGDTSTVLPTLNRLRDHGIHLSLDDFGTGYSSLNYLHSFPFEKIKIDRSFISRLGQTDDAENIIGAIIAMARSLNMTVTAEGVETQDQLAALKLRRCDQIQGFLLGRPMAKSDIEKLFAEAPHARVVDVVRSRTSIRRRESVAA
jgi:diguanylate cyclase